MLNRRHLWSSALAMLAACGCSTASLAAGDFPSKPIRLVVPFSAGGFTDTFARTIAAKMADILKEPVIIDNRVGAGGTIGGAAVAKAPPDGYTLLMGNNSVMSILPFVMKNPPYDPLKELTPISLTSQAELILVVNAERIRAKTFPELLAEVRALPETSPLRAYASVGVATTHHLAMELLKQRTGLNLTHVPYKGSTPAMQDLIGGQVPMMFNTFSEVGQFIKQGKLRAIAVARSTRSKDLPEVPTLEEQGVTGFSVVGWQALVVPVGTPPAVQKILHDAYARAVTDPATRQKLEAMGAPPQVTTQAEALAFIKADAATWAGVIKAANIAVTQ